MASIIHNATIIDPGGQRVAVLPGHSLVFEAGRVTELGPAASMAERLARGEFAQVLPAERHLLIPGLVNAHHHLFQSLTRCLPTAQDQRLFNWLLTLYPLWRSLDYEAVKLAAQVSLAELALHGCTTTSDHFYVFPPGTDVRMEAVLEAAEEIGLRIHLSRGAMTLGASAGGLPPDDCVEHDAEVLADCQRVLERYHDPRPYALRRIDLAPCSPFNVTRELLCETRDLGRAHAALLHTHLAETLAEERYCLEHLGCRPVEYLRQLGWLGPDVYLAHCVWLNDEEVRLLGQTRTGVVHCPSSNMRLGSGVAPLEELLAAGVRVGLGVDGSSSQDGGDLMAEIKQALLVARVRTSVVQWAQGRGPGERREAGVDPRHGKSRPPASATSAFSSADDGLLPVAAAFRLATTGSATCLNRPELGHLGPGAAADFALFRADDVALAGAVAHDPLAALVLCAPPRADHVFVAGRPVVRDGQLAALDEHRLAERMNQLVRARFGGGAGAPPPARAHKS